MTIPVENPKVIYQGPYNSGDQVTITFSYSEPEHVKAVIGSDEELEYNVDYSVTGQNLYLNKSVGADNTLTVYRSTPLDNEADFPQESRFPSEKIRDVIDKIIRQNQEQAEAIDRAIKLAINAGGSTEVDISSLGNLTPDAGKCLKWGEEGASLINSLYDPDEVYAKADQTYQEAQTTLDEANSAVEEAQKAVSDAEYQLSLVSAQYAQIQELVAQTQDLVSQAENLVQTAANFTMPELTTRLDRTPGEVYKAEGNGWLFICDDVSDGATYSSFNLEFSLDNVEWTPYPIKAEVPGTGRDNASILIPVPKDYYYRLTPAISVKAYYYIPSAGMTIDPESGPGLELLIDEILGEEV